MTRAAFCVVLGVLLSATAARADESKPAGGNGDTATADDEDNPLTREGRVVGLLSVSTKGVTKEAKEGFISSVENSLNLAGFRVVKNSVLHEFLADSAYVNGCTFGPCLKAVYARTKVRLVVVARISGVGSAYSFVVSLLDTTTGDLRSQNAENCLGCTVDEALMQASNLVIGAVTESGGAKVEDGNGAQLGPEGPPVDDSPRARRISGRVGLFLVGLGIAAGAAGGYLLSTDDNDDMAYAAVAGGSAFAVSGLTIFLFSRSF